MASLTFRAAMELLENLTTCIPVLTLTLPLQLPNFAFGGSFDDAALACYGILREDEVASCRYPASILFEGHPHLPVHISDTTSSKAIYNPSL